MLQNYNAKHKFRWRKLSGDLVLAVRLALDDFREIFHLLIIVYHALPVVSSSSSVEIFAKAIYPACMYLAI